MSLIVNLFGGPGSGKSTLASMLFVEFKQRSLNVELIAEYAKEWAWDEKPVKKIDEMIIYGRQLERERRFYEKKDMFAITDRPLELSYIYALMYAPSRAPAVKNIIELDRAAAGEYGTKFVNVIVKREKPYNGVGRFESEDQAKLIDEIVLANIPSVLCYNTSINIKEFVDRIISMKID